MFATSADQGHRDLAAAPPRDDEGAAERHRIEEEIAWMEAAIDEENFARDLEDGVWD